MTNSTVGKDAKPPLVEVATVTPDGTVPLGIMNAEQALSLPEDIDVVVSHPDEKTGEKETLVDRSELKELAARS